MTVSVGVLGLGFMGATHFRAYQAAAESGVDVKVAAVCDRHEVRRNGRVGGAGNIGTDADEILFESGAVTGYASPEQLFADSSVDAVSVCTYTDSHVELASAALRAGKHVLVEKPVSLDIAGVEQLNRVAQEAGRHCMPAMCMRFWPGWGWLRQSIEEGAYGGLQSLRFTRTGSPPAWATEFYGDPKRSGAALFDLHIHDVDFLYSCFGVPESLTSSGSESHLTTTYHYPGGPSVVAEGGWLEPGTAFRMEYVAEFANGVARFGFDAENPLLFEADGSVQPVEVPEGTGYDGEVRAFLQCVADPNTPLPATLEDAGNVTRILLAERESLSARGQVELR